VKPIRLSLHAELRRGKRGASRSEVEEAVRLGVREPAKLGKVLCRRNFEYNSVWQGRHFAIKQVAPVIAEEDDEIVVVTVYVFYF